MHIGWEINNPHYHTGGGFLLAPKAHVADHTFLLIISRLPIPLPRNVAQIGISPPGLYQP